MRIFGLILLAALNVVHTTRADVVRVAVASNFRAPMTDIASMFHSESGHRLVITYGASGKLFAQIVNGAPFDVFLSADQVKPGRLADRGLAVQHSQMTYAYGRLVLWSTEKTDLSIGEALLQETGRIAMANPRLAPYGQAAVETLTTLSLADQTRPRWVMGENIAQTFHFIHSGNASLGFIAGSQLGDAMRGTTWIIPADLHTPIAQDAVLLTRAARSPAANALLDFINRRSVQETINQHGYVTEK